MKIVFRTLLPMLLVACLLAACEKEVNYSKSVNLSPRKHPYNMHLNGHCTAEKLPTYLCANLFIKADNDKEHFVVAMPDTKGSDSLDLKVVHIKSELGKQFKAVFDDAKDIDIMNVGEKKFFSYINTHEKDEFVRWTAWTMEKESVALTVYD